MDTCKLDNKGDSKKRNLLLAFTGSVASIKASQLVDLLKDRYNVKVVVTNNALHFCKELNDLPEIKDNSISLYRDQDEWSSWSKRDDPVLHIELRKWADGILIAPLSANTLAKISNGMADNLLTSIIRAWDYQSKVMILAPAMNTLMWENPFTSRQLNTMVSLPPPGKESNVIIIQPISKTLICGDVGVGAMEQINKIVECVTSNL